LLGNTPPQNDLLCADSSKDNCLTAIVEDSRGKPVPERLHCGLELMMMEMVVTAAV